TWLLWRVTLANSKGTHFLSMAYLWIKQSGFAKVSQSKLVCLLRSRRRRNGNTHAEPAARPDTTPEIQKLILATLDGTRKTLKECHTQWVRNGLTLGVYMICTEMCGNCASIG